MIVFHQNLIQCASVLSRVRVDTDVQHKGDLLKTYLYAQVLHKGCHLLLLSYTAP